MVSAPGMYPEIRYVSHPVDMNNVKVGKPPRMRHDPGCGHFKMRGGAVLGTPERNDCVAKRYG